MEVIMAKMKKSSGRGAPDELEPRSSEEEEEREERGPEIAPPGPVASKSAGLIPGGIVLGLIALAILLSLLTD
jgi:hypothetical protein